MNPELEDWIFATLFFFFVGWFAICFVAWDFTWPLSTLPSRLWFVTSALIGVGFMVHRAEEREKASKGTKE